MKVWLQRIALLVLLSQSFSVLASAPSQAAVEVTIAFQGPLTGPEAYVGIPIFNSVKYSINKFNATNTDYRVQLTGVDDQGDPAISNAITPSVVDNKKIIGLVGPLYSGASRVAFPYLISAGLVAISPAASLYSLTGPSSSTSGYPVFHRTVGINFGMALAKQSIKGVSNPKVFIIDGSINRENTQQVSQVKDTLISLKANVLGSEVVPFETTDLSAVIAKIKSSGANIVIYVGYDSSAAAFIKQFRDAGLTALFSAGNVTFGKDFLSLAGKSAEGTRITTSVLDSISQYSPTLEDEYKKSTGSSSATFSIEAIDATNIMLSCISRGNIARDTLLKCVKDYKGKSFLGAEISFDTFGDISGNFTFVGEVKNSLIQFTDPITNDPIIRKISENTEAEINLKSISTRTISPGEKISWNLEVTVQPGWVKGIYFQIEDTQKQTRYLYQDLSSRFKGSVVERAESFNTDLVLQTHSGLLPGKYSVVNFCIEGSKRECVTDPKYASTFDPNRQNRSIDLDSFSFQVKDTGSNLRETPLKISKITSRKSSYSPGEVILYEVEAIGKMSLGQANLGLNFGSYGLSAYCQPTYSSNCIFVQDKEKGITKITFTFPIPEDLPPGKVELSSLYISSIGGLASSIDTSVNTTASWSTAFSYSDKAIRGENGEAFLGDVTFDFSIYSAIILDSGGGEKRSPTWANLTWKTNTVSAGSEATLTLDVNGYQRYLSAVYLYSLVSTSGNQISLKDINVSILSNDSAEGIYPLKKSGRYQIKVTIPRTAKPGSYRIGQLTVDASNCEAKSASEWAAKINSATGQCTGLNAWQTSYNNGNLTSLSWPGSESTSTLTLEILPASKPRLPNLKLISNEPNLLKIDYLHDYEITCDFTSDTGSLIHQQVSKGQSGDGINHLIVTDLKPDSTLKLTGSCIGIDGLKGDSTTVEFKTAKPIPPAVPKVTTNEIGVDSAKFDFVYREGFRYQVKSNSGTVVVSNGTIEFSRLSPDSKVKFQISITDPYSQTTTSDPIEFTTYRPKPPVLPLLQLVSKSQTRVSVSMKFEAQNEYEVTTTSGTFSILGNQINISSLKPGEQFSIVVTVTDKYQQSVTTKGSFQAELPSAPRIPSLISKSILSNELTLSVSGQDGTQLVVKSSSGVVSISGNTVNVTNLNPKTLVTINAYSVDQFGQSSSISTKSYTTRASTPQKSLTCTNGKTTKIVVGLNPTCPAGYKKR